MEEVQIPSWQSCKNDDSSTSDDSIEMFCQVEGVIGHHLVVDRRPREPLNLIRVGKAERHRVGLVLEEVRAKWNLKKNIKTFVSIKYFN